MRDLKYLQYFEDLLQSANNDLVREAKSEGRICAAYLCENTPEPLFNLGNCFGIRLTAPNTGAMDIASYYMSNLLCETVRALLERAIEGGFNFADCLIAPDGAAHCFEGRVSGEILHEARGENGFGYDPVFGIGGRSFAEYSAEEKNAVSHRHNALMQVLTYFRSL